MNYYLDYYYYNHDFCELNIKTRSNLMEKTE